MYKLFNSGDERFEFEGVVIEKFSVSKELPIDVYQRLLALYWHKPLEPFEDAQETPVQEIQVAEGDDTSSSSDAIIEVPTADEHILEVGDSEDGEEPEEDEEPVEVKQAAKGRKNKSK